MSGHNSGKLKLLHIMKYLIENTDEQHSVTSNQLVNYLQGLGIDCERKSVYADIEVLKTFGMDIESKGRRGGYYVNSGYFELPELKLLVDAVQVSKFITQKKTRHLIEKLSHQTSKYNAKQLKRDVIIANRTKTGNENIYYNIDYIHQAIEQHKKINFTYMEWSIDKQLIEKGKNYAVIPWLLIWNDERYYLVGYDCRIKQKRHYRVDKIKNVRIGRENHVDDEERSNFDPSGYGRSVFDMFSGSRKQLKIRFDNKLIGVVLDQFGTDISVIQDTDNTFFAYLEIDVSNRFFGWLAGFGNMVTIIEPTEVAIEFKDFLSKIIKNY